MVRYAALLVTASLLMACAPDEPTPAAADRDTIYQLISIDGAPVPYNASIQFAEAGRISGQAPCNRYSAAQTSTLPAINIEAIAATRMACPALALETLFFDSLQVVTTAEWVGDKLVLTGPIGLVMVFQAS